MTFRILTVCTGNVCRSPQAEQLLRARFEALGVGVEVSSAGTYALVGDAMPTAAAALSREFGGEPTGHAPRQLTRDLVSEADLILALAREHRSAVAKLVPLASRKTFTLREFARVLEKTVALSVNREAGDEGAPAIDVPEAGDLGAWLALAQRYRGWFGGSPDDDDVIDPFRRSANIYRLSAEQIVPAVTTITSVTSGATPS
jgi:protein-tyrosine phosphatase